jgi:hypothetical protein
VDTNALSILWLDCSRKQHYNNAGSIHTSISHLLIFHSPHLFVTCVKFLTISQHCIISLRRIYQSMSNAILINLQLPLLFILSFGLIYHVPGSRLWNDNCLYLLLRPDIPVKRWDLPATLHTVITQEPTLLKPQLLCDFDYFLYWTTVSGVTNLQPHSCSP